MTTYTESFNKADSTTVGPDLTWSEVSGSWEVVSNRLVKTSAVDGVEFIRAEHDVSSNDNYCQIQEYTTEPVGGPCCRFSASAATCYETHSFGGNIYVVKFVGGTQTDLSSTAYTWSSTDVLKVQASGTTIKSFVNGVEKISLTDSSIASGTRGGVMSYRTGVNYPLDNFEVGDLGGGGFQAAWARMANVILGAGR